MPVPYGESGGYALAFKNGKRTPLTDEIRGDKEAKRLQIRGSLHDFAELIKSNGCELINDSDARNPAHWVMPDITAYNQYIKW